MGISSRRLKSLVNSGNGRLMCYLIGFAVTVFLIIYMLIR
jgi:blocked-early-in-transport protein 1